MAIRNNQSQWSQAQIIDVRQRLETLAQLPNKAAGWVTKDLTITQSSWISRIFWAVVKPFKCLREIFYSVNLEQSQATLESIKPHLSYARNLIPLFNRAVAKFNQIAPHHAVEDYRPSVTSQRPPAPREDRPINKKTISQAGQRVRSSLNSSQGKNNEKALEVSNLITQFESSWDKESGTFKNIPFDQEKFINRITEHNQAFASGTNYTTHFGFIDKVDVDSNSQIFVRADIHGSLKSVIENLRTLQNQGLLDENFCCRRGVHLVFLGDYMDRGAHGVHVMELLTALRMANKGQVHLIRGNHEDVSINRVYCGADGNLRNLINLEDDRGVNLLTQLYQTMPLTLYIGSQDTVSGKKEYVQFTHGLFEPHVDPAQILDGKEPYARMSVSKEIELSERIKKIEVNESSNSQELLDRLTKKTMLSAGEKNQRRELKQKLAAKRIKHLVRESKAQRVEYNENDMTAYNWADVGENRSWIGTMGRRRWFLGAQDIKHYMRLSSAQNKVKMIFRGHEHRHKHLKMNNGKALVTTLSIGNDTGHERYDTMNPHDIAYLLTTAPKAKEWTKQALQRKKGSSETEIANPVSIHSDAV